MDNQINLPIYSSLAARSLRLGSNFNGTSNICHCAKIPGANSMREGLQNPNRAQDWHEPSDIRQCPKLSAQ